MGKQLDALENALNLGAPDLLKKVKGELGTIINSLNAGGWWIEKRTEDGDYENLRKVKLSDILSTREVKLLYDAVEQLKTEWMNRSHNLPYTIWEGTLPLKHELEELHTFMGSVVNETNRREWEERDGGEN